MASAMVLMLPCPSPRLGTSQFADHPEEPQCLLRVIGLARSDYQGDNHAPLDPDAGGQRSGHPENPLFRQVGAKSTNLTRARTGVHPYSTYRLGAMSGRSVRTRPLATAYFSRSHLFADLSAVFMDTASLSFYGEGGETLGEYGYSKDYRPDLKQMILGLIVDGDSRPICTEMWPGNTADVTTLPVVDRLRQRFSIGRVCVVADRGMISAAAIAGLEERKLEY